MNYEAIINKNNLRIEIAKKRVAEGEALFPETLLGGIEDLEKENERLRKLAEQEKKSN